MTIDEVSLNEVLDRYGISRDGRIARCCFHGPDANPSLRIYEATQTFYCFGCGKYGDSATIVAYEEGIGYYEACRLLGVTVEDVTIVATSPTSIAARTSRPSVSIPPSTYEVEIEFARVVRGLWSKLEMGLIQKLVQQFDVVRASESTDQMERFLSLVRGVEADAYST